MSHTAVWWWLRSPYYNNNNNFCNVNNNGNINNNNASWSAGVRPGFCNVRGRMVVASAKDDLCKRRNTSLVKA